MGSKDDILILHKNLKILLVNLQDTVVNSTYLRSISVMANKNKSIMLIAKKEEPLMVYYNAIIKQIEVSLAQGQKWIPEQLVLCLLSEWILEEENQLFYILF